MAFWQGGAFTRPLRHFVFYLKGFTEYEALLSLTIENIDFDFYQFQCDQEFGSVSEAARHYVRVGRMRGADIRPDFSASAYVQTYDDVRESSCDPYFHFVKYGRREGRSTVASELGAAYRRHRLARHFDADLYRKRYLADETDVDDPLAHYLSIGWRLDYAPNADFVVKDYKVMHGAELSGQASPLEHYIDTGVDRVVPTSLRSDIILRTQALSNANPTTISIALFVDRMTREETNFLTRYWSKPYLAKGLGVEQCFRSCSHTFAFVFSTLGPQAIDKVMGTGAVIYRSRADDGLTIVLSISRPFNNEGELALTLRDVTGGIFVLGFSVVPGEVLNVEARDVLYVTRVQGVAKRFDAAKRATKVFGDISPPYILFTALQGVAQAWGIKVIVGVDAPRQLSDTPERREKFIRQYDQFFESNSPARIDDGQAVFYLPVQQKPIEEVKRGHRIRTVAKRRAKQAIIESVFHTFSACLRPPTERQG